MRTSFCAIFTTALFAMLICAYASPCAAQQEHTNRRKQGPASGPAIPLPLGQGALSDQQSEPSEQKQSVREPLPKWEYCAITNIISTRKDQWSKFTGIAYIHYFRGGGEQVEGANEDEALAKAMTKLGEEGWELVAIREVVGLSEGTGSSSAKYFFKRQLFANHNSQETR